MSIENAILELAAAIREMAKANAPQVRTEVRGDPALVAMRQAHEAAELETAVTQVETDAKAAQQKAMDKVSTGKQEIAAALARAKEESDQKAADFQKKIDADKAAAQAQVNSVNSGGDPLDYAKDIQPILTKVGKNRDQLVTLLAKFGAKKGADIKAEDYPAIFAESNAILAARG